MQGEKVGDYVIRLAWDGSQRILFNWTLEAAREELKKYLKKDPQAELWRYLPGGKQLRTYKGDPDMDDSRVGRFSLQMPDGGSLPLGPMTVAEAKAAARKHAEECPRIELWEHTENAGGVRIDFES